MPLAAQQVEALVTALLAVNGYPLDRAAALMPGFRKAGLLDHARVRELDADELVSSMTNAGYARGGFVPILAYRLASALEAVESGRFQTLPALAQAGDEAGFAKVLGEVHGFGPRTAAAAWLLWTAA